MSILTQHSRVVTLTSLHLIPWLLLRRCALRKQSRKCSSPPLKINAGCLDIRVGHCQVPLQVIGPASPTWGNGLRRIPLKVLSFAGQVASLRPPAYPTPRKRFLGLSARCEHSIQRRYSSTEPSPRSAGLRGAAGRGSPLRVNPLMPLPPDPPKAFETLAAPRPLPWIVNPAAALAWIDQLRFLRVVLP